MRVTNWKRNAAVSLAATGMISIASPGTADAQSTLIFEDSGVANNVNLAGSGYGDNLAGTPNVTLTWGAGWQSYINWDGRGVVGQLDYNAATVPNPIDLTFNPGAGFGVWVTSFDLDEFVGGGDTIVNWEIVGTSFSGVWDAFSDANGGNGGRTNISTGMTAADALAAPLTLRFSRVSGLTSYIAADNIAFNQAVIPEPTSAAFIVGGLGAVALRRRRK